MKIYDENVKELHEIRRRISYIHSDSYNLENKDNMAFYQALNAIDILIEIGQNKKSNS